MPPTTNAQRGEPSRADALVNSQSGDTSSSAPSPAAEISFRHPDGVTPQLTRCSGCGKFCVSPGVWLEKNDPDPRMKERSLISHGLCPDCVNTYSYSRPVPDTLRNARILRTMIQGNLDMAARLIQIGDPGMALAELNQAMVKTDQFLNELSH